MDYKDYNDNELLMYIRENSEEANEIMFQKYQPLIVTYAKKLYPYAKKNGLEFNDLTQEGMLGLNLALQSYQEGKDSIFYTFAKKCIERKMITALVSAQRQKHKILNESLSLDYQGEEENSVSLNYFLSDEKANPLNQLLSSEKEQELIRKIKEILTDNEERVFELKLAGFQYKEIASILDKTPKAIDNALQRIRIKIQEKIQG